MERGEGAGGLVTQAYWGKNNIKITPLRPSVFVSHNDPNERGISKEVIKCNRPIFISTPLGNFAIHETRH